MVENKFVKDNLYYFISVFFINIKGLFLVPILIKNVGVSIYGDYSLIISFLGFLFGISSFGISYSFKRYFPGSKDINKKRKLFYYQFYLHFLFLLFLLMVLIFTWPMLSQEMNLPFISVGFLALWMFSSFLYSQMLDYYRFNNQISFFSIYSLLYPYISILTIMIVLGYYNNLNLNVLVIIDGLTMLILSVFLLPKVLYELGLIFPKISFNFIKLNLKLGLPLVFNYVLDFVMNFSDRFVIVFFLSSTFVGVYNPAYMIGSFFLLISKVLNVVLQIFISKLEDVGKKMEASKLFLISQKVVLVFGFLALVINLNFGKRLLAIFANDFVANNSQFIPVIINIGAIFYGMNILYSTRLFVKKKQRTYLELI